MELNMVCTRGVKCNFFSYSIQTYIFGILYIIILLLAERLHYANNFPDPGSFASSVLRITIQKHPLPMGIGGISNGEVYSKTECI